MKVLITTRSFRRMEGPHKALLRAAGCELIDSPYERPASAAELRPLLRGMDAVILGLDEVNAEALAEAERLRVISRYGVGLDQLDLAAASERGIVVTNTPGANRVAVAEMALGLMFALARQIPAQHQAVLAGGWQPLPAVELSGSTLGILGLGQIGRELAQRAAALGMQVLCYDPIPAPPDFLAQWGLEECSLEKLLRESDFISLHLPYLPETHHLINAASLAQMKASAYLINTARGGIVDEAALYAALQAGQVAGAAFDAFAQEPPPPDHPLLHLPNFIATPHAASATRQTTLKMGLLAAENALAVLRGERPAHVVNPEVYG